MPDFPIIDSHVHLYDPGLIGYSWMREVPVLDRPHLPEHLFADTGVTEIEALVFIEVNADPGAHLQEAEFIGRLAQQEPRIRAVVASLPLHDPAPVDEQLDTLAGMPLVRGVRTLIETHADESGWSLDARFVDRIRSLAERNLSFDLCLKHTQLGDVIEVVERCPEVSFVLDHIAKPDIRGARREPWQSQLRILAQAENVCCKLSGVVTEADHSAWTLDQVAPYMTYAIECFGFDRVLFGGDWPVSTLACDYATWVETVDRVVADATPDEQRRLYRDNASRVYRLGLS